MQPKKAQAALLWSNVFLDFSVALRDLICFIDINNNWLKHCEEGIISIWHTVFFNENQKNFPEDQPCRLNVPLTLMVCYY